MTARDVHYNHLRHEYSGKQTEQNISMLTSHVLEHNVGDEVLCEVTLKRSDGAINQLEVRVSDLFTLLGVSARVDSVLNHAIAAENSARYMLNREDPKREDLQNLYVDLGRLRGFIDAMASPHKVSEKAAKEWNDKQGQQP